MSTALSTGAKLFAAVALFFPQSALAGGLRLVAELPELRHDSLVRKISAQRFVIVRTTWERDEKQRPKMPHYWILDLEARLVVDVPVPIRELPKSHTDVLGSANPSAELVHYDGSVVSLTFNARRGYEATTATYFCQYDQRANRFSELVRLSRWDDTGYFYDLGFNPTDTYFYYATAVNPAGKVLQQGYTSLEIARIHLKTRAIDWTMKVDLPKRDKPLKLVSGPKVFSRDGSRLALVEYSDKGIQRNWPPKPQQQVLVVDITSKQVDSYPAPLSAYGVLFSPDNRYLALGSSELGEIVRIDLVGRKVDAKMQGKRLMNAFLPTPSGNTFLVTSNTLLASPKVVEVRRFSDLKLQASIPMRMLYPGSDGVNAFTVAGLEGRILMLPFVAPNGWATDTGVRLYEVPDDIDSAGVAGSKGGDLKTAQGIVLGKQFADAHRIRYKDAQEDPAATFKKMAVMPTGDVIVNGIFSGNSDGDYKVGRTRPVVVRLDSKGKPRWQRVLTRKGFLDYEDGSVAPTPDGGCVVHIRSYVHPGRAPVTRVVKLDAHGTTKWDHRFRGDGGPKTALADQLDLLPDGSVSITGRYYEDAENTRRRSWKALIDAAGNVVLDEVAP